MDWQQSFRKRLRTISEVNKYFGLELPEVPFEINIPLSLAGRIKEQGLQGVLAKQFIPSSDELNDGGLADPIGDSTHYKKGQIIHRYQNRVLFLPTTVCPVICRYCFRKNSLSNKDEIYKSEFEQTLSYLKEHEEINEIIFSGGDPLMMSPEKIDFYLEQFSNLEHIKYIRFHTRTPISLPEKVDSDLLNILEKFESRFFMTMALHVNHKDEIDQPVIDVFSRLNKRRLNLISQTVLLKNINNSTKDLCELFEFLSLNNIRPYYLHHPDKVKGGMHFQIDISEGRKLFATLRPLLPGWMLPHYILDIPGGHGKTPIFNPESFDFSGKVISLNKEYISL